MEPVQGVQAKSARATYPPKHHFLRDLRIFVEQDEDAFHAGIEVVPALCTEAGGIRAGALATLVDVVAGAQAATAIAPNWLATGDLALHLLRAQTSGVVIATAKILRQGRGTVVIEVDLSSEADSSQPIGIATVAFSILEARGEAQSMGERPRKTRTEFGIEGSGFTGSLDDTLGLREIDTASGHFELLLSPYNTNSLGALQGGALAMLVDAAAEAAGRKAGRANWVTTDFSIHFLALGRKGPLVSAARVLRDHSGDALLRIEIRDEGAENRLISVATATCESLS